MGMRRRRASQAEPVARAPSPILKDASPTELTAASQPVTIFIVEATSDRAAPGSTPTAHCLDCGYLIHGLPSPVCPECGRRFDPLKPHTFRTGPRIPRWQAWAEPPRLWHILPVVLITLLAFDAASSPMGSSFASVTFALSCGGFLLAIGLPLDYLSRAIATFIYRKRLGAFARAIPGGRWRWAVTPLCVVVIAASFSSDRLLRARFALSQSHFQSIAQSCAKGTPPTKGQRVGLYFVRRVDTDINGVISFVTGNSMSDSVGFEYHPGDLRSNFGFAGWYQEEW